MRLTYLHQYFNTPSMKGGTRSYEMARRLVAKGHSVNLVTSCRETFEKRGWFTTEESGIQVHWYPLPYSNNMSFRERIGAFLRFAVASSQKAAELPADIIYATSTPLTIALPGLWGSRLRNIPMVFEVRDLWPELAIAMGALPNPVLRGMGRLLERMAYAGSKAVVALSPGMKEGILRTGYPVSRVSVIPNASDLDLFEPDAGKAGRFLEKFPHLEGKRLVVYTGTFGLINGVDYLVRISRSASDRGSNLQFLVVGEGKGEEQVRALAEEIGVLGRNFHMIRSVPKEEIPEILSAADLALSLFINLRPMWANSANKFFDALASGTPVAINYGGWQADLLRETGAGIVLPAEDAEGAAERIRAFLYNPDRVKAAGVAARQLAEERFDRNMLAEQLESLLLNALADS